MSACGDVCVCVSVCGDVCVSVCVCKQTDSRVVGVCDVREQQHLF